MHTTWAELDVMAKLLMAGGGPERAGRGQVVSAVRDGERLYFFVREWHTGIWTDSQKWRKGLPLGQEMWGKG